MSTSDAHESHRREPSNLNPWNPAALFARCWRWALPIGIVLAGITAFALVYSFVPKYRASCLLEASSDYVVFEGVMETIRNLAKSERDLILNESVLEPVLSEPGVRDAPSLTNPEDAHTNLCDNLSVTSGENKSLMIVSYEDTDPDAASLVCNTVVDSYLRLRDSFDQAKVSNLERWLAPAIQRWEQEVQSHRQRVARLSERVYGYDPDDVAANVQNEESRNFVAKLRSRIDDVSLKIEILEAQIVLDEPTTVSDSESQASKSEMNAERVQKVKEMIRKRDLLAAELRVLEERWSKEKAKLEQFGGDTAELQFAKDELAVANDVLSKLRDRIARIRTERRRDGAVRILAHAKPPTEPAESLPMKKIVGLSTAAFLAPLVLGLLFGFVPRRETDPEPVESNGDDD